MLHRVLVVIILASLVIGSSLPAHQPVRAAVNSCTATLTPHTVTPGSTTNFQLSITNNDPDNDIQHILILRPSDNFTILDATSDGWANNVQPDQIIMDSNAIPAPDTHIFDIQAEAANVEAGASNWSVFVSDSPDGSGSVTCDNDTATEITSGDPFQLSTPTVANVTATTATITWTSNRPATSSVSYGLTASYGSTATGGSSFQTTHSLTLTGLTPSAAYHYRVQSTADDGASAQSGSNTFQTTAQPVTPPASAPGASNVPGVTIKPVPTETVPPTIELTTNLSRPFLQAPTITGTASDNEAVARIEYSVDDGANWLPADRITRLIKTGQATTASVAFEFKPFLIEDGSYKLKARATDTSGNIATTPTQVLVIDRLPPQVGPLLVSYGPEVLTPDDKGVLNLLAGTDYRLAVSAVGGPTGIVLEAQPREDAEAVSTSFALSQSADSGLWSGLLSFKKGGIYQLVARSVDGAGNQTVRPLMMVAVTPAGRVLKAGTSQPVAGAKLTLYYLEPASRSWQPWDARPYGQSNPQATRADGSYSLLIPKGEYYLTVEAPRWRSFTSDRFVVDQPMALASTFELKALPQIKLGSARFTWPQFSWQSYPLPVPAQKPITSSLPLTGRPVPDFDLPATSGGTRTNLSFEGKPTVFTILATWSPSSQEQLSALAQVQANGDVNVVPVFSQERLRLVTAYLATAGYRLNGLVDTDGVVVQSFQIGALPQHIFVDRSGRIKKVTLGVLSEQKLLDQLGGL